MCALFEFAGQQKSAGLMVDKTNKPALCFLYITFQILAPYLRANRALKGNTARKHGKLWEITSLRVFILRKYHFLIWSILGKIEKPHSLGL